MIALSTGEPAGIGPDICLSLALAPRNARLVALADPELMRERARQLGVAVEIHVLEDTAETAVHRPGSLQVCAHRLRAPVVAGRTDPANAPYVIDLLTEGAAGCLAGRYDALVTAPVQKSVIA
ncbi:MAG TPA: 4-hydroxythreonine-4-phosphate dehydrogenase PdxA, partial [Gammaproteobacteria bacterium]|nr:4-hydroxythreonine-4-phosphate dehydrogenase PdxA [Gammaproteobacteria bacterium]